MFLCLTFLVLQKLHFIFVPLVFSMFIALLFLPLMRWLKKKRVPKILSLIIVGIIISVFFLLLFESVKLASMEIRNSKTDFIEKLKGLLEVRKQYTSEQIEDLGLLILDHLNRDFLALCH